MLHAVILLHCWNIWDFGHFQDAEDRKTSEILQRSPPQTAFIRAPLQIHGMAPSLSQPPLVGHHNFNVAPVAQPMHAYARPPVQFTTPPDRPPIPSTRVYPPPHQSKVRFPCKAPNCGVSFPTVQMLVQHQQAHKSAKPFLGEYHGVESLCFVLFMALTNRLRAPRAVSCSDGTNSVLSSTRCWESLLSCSDQTFLNVFAVNLHSISVD